MSDLLPKKKIKSTRKNPKTIVIFSQPKSGKTTAVADLKDCLVLDLESGSDFVDALKIDIRQKAKENDELPIQTLKKVTNAIKEKNKEAGKYIYKFIALDTVTALEDISKALAKRLYNATPMGKNWVGNDVTTLPNGAGYKYLRDAVTMVISDLEEACDTLIILGHVRDRAIEKEGKEMDIRSLDLTGKLSSIVCSQVDAIGYLYRKENKTIINFKPSESLVCGARSEHLKEREIEVITSDENRKLTVDWSKIFID